MTRATITLALLTTMLCVGCRAIDARTEFDPTARFDGLQSYQWAPVVATRSATGPTEVSNPILDARIRAAVDRQLAAQGFVKNESGAPDFLVGFHATTEQKVDVSTMGSDYEYRNDWAGYPSGYRGAGFRNERTERYYYEEGTLILNISLPENNQLIWRGVAQAELNRQASQEERDRRLAEAVQKILSQFPPRTSPDGP